MFVYSGKCRFCKTGYDTGITDYAGNPLYTGDIVLAFTENDLGVSFVGDLTVVVSDQYQTYSDGTHVLKNGEPEFFVMGIRDVNLTAENGEWRVKKLKSHSDVVTGEHWPEWGFSFEEV